MQKKQSSLVKQASFMAVGTLISRVFGLLRDLLIAAFFSKNESDIFFVAFRFPNFFRRFLGEGSFSGSVTPALAESLEKDKDQAFKLHSHLFTLLLYTVSVLTLIGFFFIDDLLHLFFSDTAYAKIPGKMEKTVIVARIVFTYVFFVSLYSYFMSALQVFGRFFLSAMAPAFFNLSLIVFMLLPGKLFPFPSYALALAVIVGGVFQLLPLMYEIKKLGFFPTLRKPLFSLVSPFLSQRFLPGLLGLSCLSLLGIINLYFVGDLEEGSVSYLYYGDRLLEFPRALIAVSLGSALVPNLSRHFALGDLSSLKKDLAHSLHFLLFLTLPCAVVFFLFSKPLIALLFGRGQFDEVSISQTAMVLSIYSLVLIFSSLSRLFTSAFSAINKNWYVALCTMWFLVFHFFFAQYATKAYGLKGLVFATAFSYSLYTLVLAGVLSFFIPAFDLRKLFVTLLKLTPGLLLLSLWLKVYPFLSLALGNVFEGVLLLFLSVFLILIPGGFLYLFSCLLFKEEGAREFASMLKVLLRKVSFK